MPTARLSTDVERMRDRQTHDWKEYRSATLLAGGKNLNSSLEELAFVHCAGRYYSNEDVLQNTRLCRFSLYFRLTRLKDLTGVTSVRTSSGV